MVEGTTAAAVVVVAAGPTFITGVGSWMYLKVLPSGAPVVEINIIFFVVAWGSAAVTDDAGTWWVASTDFRELAPPVVTAVAVKGILRCGCGCFPTTWLMRC